MKFSIVRSTFIEGLKAVQNIVGGKGCTPVLQNVMLEAKGSELNLTTTDIDISIKSTVPCEVKEEGESTLPVKLLATSILKAPEGVVEVEIDENERANTIRLMKVKDMILQEAIEERRELDAAEGSGVAER